MVFKIWEKESNFECSRGLLNPGILSLLYAEDERRNDKEVSLLYF